MSTAQITYPSGRQVQYTWNTTGRITAVKSRKISTDALSNIATAITYQPLSNLIAGFTYGNALTFSQTHTLDYEVNRCRVLDGATAVIDRTHARTDGLNLTGITDNVTAGNTMTFGYSAANRLNASTGPWGTLGWSYDLVVVPWCAASGGTARRKRRGRRWMPTPIRPAPTASRA